MQIPINELFVVLRQREGIDIAAETLYSKTAAENAVAALEKVRSINPYGSTVLSGTRWRVLSLTDAIAELTQEIERASLARATAGIETPEQRSLRQAAARPVRRGRPRTAS